MNELNKQYNVEWNLKPYQREYDDRIAPFYTGPFLFRATRLIEFVGGPLAYLNAVLHPNNIAAKTLTNEMDNISLIDCRRLATRRIESPAATGFTNAHSVRSFFLFIRIYINSNNIATIILTIYICINNVDREIGCYDG